MKLVGLLGGTFDPVHCGHLELAGKAMEEFGLVRVLFLPTASPPHKRFDNVVSFEHRVEMIRLAIKDDTRFALLEIESNIPAPNYTINTLSLLLQKGETENEYVFIIGIDAFLDIHLWKDHERVLSAIHFIIAARAGYRRDELLDYLKLLKYKKNGNHWYNDASLKKIYYLDCDITDVSSSDVRQKLAAGESLKEVVPPGVMHYITYYNLYGSGELEE
jgi:nicotinate-nucleotide adenylyltransferase